MLFSQPIMENQIQSTNQVRANIMRQQPVNTTESVTSASIPKPTLEERIRTMKSLTKLIPTSTPISQSYAIDLTGNCINRSISITNKTSIIQCQPTTIMANVSNVLSSSTSQTLIQSSSSPIATSIRYRWVYGIDYTRINRAQKIVPLIPAEIHCPKHQPSAA